MHVLGCEVWNTRETARPALRFAGGRARAAPLLGSVVLLPSFLPSLLTSIFVRLTVQQGPVQLRTFSVKQYWPPPLDTITGFNEYAELALVQVQYGKEGNAPDWELSKTSTWAAAPDALRCGDEG